MPVLEGVGSMMIIGGILALVGTAVHPSMWQTFVPIGLLSCVGGFLLTGWARRAPPPL